MSEKDLMAALKAAVEDAEEAIHTCPAGEACPIHNRKDVEIFRDDDLYACIVTYVGEFVVITADNPELSSVAGALSYLMGAGDVKTYETAVYRVGDGVAGDLSNLSPQERIKARVYGRKYDEYETTAVFHQDVVDWVRAGEFRRPKGEK